MSKSYSLSWMRKKPKTSSRQRSERAGSPSASDRLQGEVADSESAVSALRGRASARKGKSPGITPALKREASATRSGWLLLKKTLETIRDGSDLCLPLKAVLVGVVAAMEMADNVKDARGGFSEIARKIEGFRSIFAQYESADDIPPIIRKRLERLSEELEPIKESIEARTKRGRFRRMLEAPSDIEDIESAFQELASVMEKFKIDCSLNTERQVEDMAADNVLTKLEPIPDAGFESQHADACMKGTRVGLLQELDAWSKDPEAPRIFCLDGMAGTGKSAIARSFCDALEQGRLLGGSFFCSRGTRRDDVKCILPTLATSFARRHAAYKLALLDVLREYPDAAHNRLDLQVERLLEKPLHDAFGPNSPTWVWVIDALDECADVKATELMLTALVSKSPNIPIKFFITSRPERHIRAQLGSRRPHLHRILRLHDVEQHLVQADISLYIKKRLEKIRDQRTISDDSYTFPSDWPTDTDIAAITNRADKLFIYAFTTVEYVQECPVERLQDLTGSVISADQPLTTALDDMYSFILTQALDPQTRKPTEISLTKRILAAVLIIREPLCVSSLGDLIGVPAQQTRNMLDRLHAVVNMPSRNDSGVVSTFHASFGDYLTTRERAKDYFIDSSDGHYNLARSCITTMGSDLLYFNVSGCRTSYLPTSKLTLETMPAHLVYSCSYWSHHLVAVPDMSSLLPSVEQVFRRKFLFWIEVLSAVGKVSLASRLILRVLTSQHLGQSVGSVTAFLNDANDFVVSSLEAIELSPAHIYLSALTAIDPTSWIAEEFWPKFQNTPALHVEGIDRRRKTILHIQGHTDIVHSTTFSPDGTRIVSGSGDKTIGIWDARTGEALVKPLEGHTDGVTSVAFSPDGTRIVSSSADRTIRVWDTNTGDALLNPLEGHTATVVSVAFSPDNTRIASGSFDKTVRFWDARTGQVLGKPLVGHTDTVWSVAFSPDGSRIASGSLDKTIRVWDGRTGDTLVKPFEGHTNNVFSVAFSPDGTSVASGSMDTTIRLWDASSGELLVKPLEGHTNTVTSVTFSPDGTRIVSGSHDRTVRVWDARSGESLINPLEGHTDGVCSVAFSPNSTHIVSSSQDKTIRMWDARPSEALVRPLEGHTEWVASVAFSPDGTCIVSGSADKTIRVWDARTGKALVKPFEGHTGLVCSVAFSPDGTHIASGSFDETIRVWDARTGEALIEPLKGHTDHVYSVAFSPDGRFVVSGSRDKTIRVWDARTGKASVSPLEGHTDGVGSVAFSPDGTHIASGSFDETIRVWDARTGEVLLVPFEGHTDGVVSIAFSPDGSSIVSGSIDKTIRVWDVRTGELLVQPLEGHTAEVLSISFSPDGSHIVSSSADSTIRVWDARTGKVLVKPLDGHTDAIHSVAFSPDGTRIVSASGDKMIRVWDATIAEGGTMSHVVAFSQCRSGRRDARSPSDKSTSELCPASSINHSFTPDSLYEGSSIDDPRDIFSLESSGWIKGPRGELVLWVPVNYNSSLWWPRNTLIIGQSRAFYDLSRFYYGVEWARCYTP